MQSPDPKRTPACDPCRHHKIKCIDKDNPPCKRCRSLHLSCTFGAGLPNDDSPARITRVENQMREVQSTLKEMSALLRSSQPLPVLPTSSMRLLTSPLDPPVVEDDFLTTAATTAPMSDVLYEDEQARLREDHTQSKKRRYEEISIFEGPPREHVDMTASWRLDPIDQGICTVSEATEWFQNYFTGAHNYLPVFDIQRDTFDELRKRSPLAISVILMIGQRCRELHDAGKLVQARLKTAAEPAAMLTLFSPLANLETVQAMLILSCWGDTAWRPGVQALAIAVDLGLHLCLPRLVETGMGANKSPTELEQDAALVAGARVFLAVCKAVIEMCFNYGRAIPFPFDYTIKYGRKLLGHPLSVISDSRCVASNEVYGLRIPLHDPWNLRPSVRANNDTAITEAKTRLHEWATHWRGYYEIQGVPSSHFLVGELLTIEYYAVLQINAAVLYGVRERDDILSLTRERRSWLEAAIQAASTLVARVARRSEMSNLRYGNRYAHLGLVMAARYLVRLACLLPEVMDLKQAASDVEVMAEKLATLPGFRFAGFLRSIVSRARQRQELPPASRLASPQPAELQVWDFGDAEELFSSQDWLQPLRHSVDPNVWFPFPPLGDPGPDDVDVPFWENRILIVSLCVMWSQICWLALTLCVLAVQPVAKYRPLPCLKEQDELEKKWVQMRYDRIPGILEEHGYDAWILSMREYAEDTAFRSLVSSTTQFYGRRRTLFMFHTRPNITNPLHIVSLKDDLWEGLLETLEQVNPEKIAVNIDDDMAFADGLHTGEGRLLMSKLGPWADKVSSDRAIGVEVVALRAGGQEQLELYRLLQENVWAMIQEGFSNKVIEVGKTTAEDLEWWFRETMTWKLGSRTWFHPTVDIYRSPHEPPIEDHPAMRQGDMLHVDIGIYAMGMNTDTQHLGYILRSNESNPPQSLLDGLTNANKMQDLNRKEMVPGRTGDEVFWAIRKDMTKAGLNENGRIYSHPIGDYGHSAGAVIGMADWQDSIPGGGGNKVLKDYWTSVELSGTSYVAEWGREQNFELEEDVYWCEDTGHFEWVFGQQTEFHLVRPKEHKHGASWMSRVAARLGWEIVRWI